MTSFDSFLNASLNNRPFEVFQLAGDASSRRYFRIVSGEDQWCSWWEPFVDDGNYPFLSVRDHFEKHGVTVPRVIAKSPSEGLVLLEDLGDLTLERKFWENQNQEMVLPFYEQSIDELIKIHYHATFDNKSSCTAFKVAFDVEKLLWEMNYGREHMFKLAKVNLSEAEHKALDDVFHRICSALNEEKKFIAHRDYHSRNVMLKLGKTRVIDFQDARMGTIQYDLVSLLRDSYVAINDTSANHLINYYLDKRKEVSSKYSLAPLSRAEFDRVYEIQSVQRTFKARGSFSSFYNNRNDTRYLKYIYNTMQTVKRSLEPQREYSAFYQILNDHGMFDRKFDDLT